MTSLGRDYTGQGKYGWRSGRRAPAAKDSKRAEQYWLDQSADEIFGLGDRASEEGYYGQRERGADAYADRFYDRYEHEFDTLYGDQGPQAGEYTDPTYEAPDFRFDREEPAPGAFGFDDYDTYAGKNRHLTGSTEEGDLSAYGDRDYYLGQEPPKWLMDRLSGGSEIGSPNFDRDFARYAEGASGRFRSDLSREVGDLTGTAAGRGRLSTGFYDEDVGRLATDLTAQYQDMANMRAVDVLGLKAQDADSRRRASTSRGQLALDAANLNLDAGQAAARAAIDRAEQARANRGEVRSSYENDRDSARGIYESDRDFGEDVYRNRRTTARGEFESDRGFGRGSFESDRAHGRGVYEDDRDFAEDAWRNRRDTRLNMLDDSVRVGADRSRDAYDRSEGQRDRYYDWLSGTTDRAQGREEARKERKNKFWSGVINTAGTLAGKALA